MGAAITVGVHAVRLIEVTPAISGSVRERFPRGAVPGTRSQEYSWTYTYGSPIILFFDTRLPTERMGLTPDWIIHAAAYQVFGLPVGGRAPGDQGARDVTGCSRLSGQGG